MSGSSALFDDLTGFAALTTLINNGDSPLTYRLYPGLMPQDPTYPAVTYQLIAGTRETPIADAGGTGVERNLFQISVWDDNLVTAEAVMDQVRLALKDAAPARHYVPQVKRQIFEPDTRLFGVQYDFSQWYR